MIVLVKLILIQLIGMEQVFPVGLFPWGTHHVPGAHITSLGHANSCNSTPTPLSTLPTPVRPVTISYELQRGAGPEDLGPNVADSTFSRARGSRAGPAVLTLRWTQWNPFTHTHAHGSGATYDSWF
jgi:hypothetical protein